MTLVTEAAPVLVTGRGPQWWSTCQEVALRGSQSLCFDVNHYYRDLGIPWPYTHASRADLRKAFLALDGPNSPRLTYVFSQLLDAEIKAIYDAWPLGSEMPDRYVYERERNARLANLSHTVVEAEMEGQEESYASWLLTRGREAEPEDTLSRSILDKEARRGEDVSQPAEEYPYRILLMGTQQYSREVLARWQELLLLVVRARKIELSVTLGVMEGQGADWMVGKVPMRGETRAVVFLDRWFAPSLHEASRIIYRLMSDQ